MGRTPRTDSEMESMVECIEQPIVDAAKTISGPVHNFTVMTSIDPPPLPHSDYSPISNDSSDSP